MLLLSSSAFATSNLNTNLDSEDIVVVEDRDQVQHIIDRIKAETTLTAAQESQIRTIGANFNFDNVSRDQRRVLRKQFRDRVRDEVLTPQQMADIRK